MAVLAVLGMVAGALYGLLGPSTYSAQSLLLVGTFEVPANAVPGYVLASQTVAGTYARFATSNDVLNLFATNLGVSVDDARGRVTVAAVPESAVIRVSASGSDADEARAASEAMAGALATYVTDDVNGKRSADLQAQYEAAQEEYVAAQATNKATPTPANQVAENLAKTKVDGLEAQVKTEQETISTSSQIRSLGSATVSEESKGLDTLVYIAIGLVVGVGLGLVVGLVLDARREPRVAIDAEPVAGNGDGARPRQQKEGVGAR